MLAWSLPNNQRISSSITYKDDSLENIFCLYNKKNQKWNVIVTNIDIQEYGGLKNNKYTVILFFVVKCVVKIILPHTWQNVYFHISYKGG